LYEEIEAPAAESRAQSGSEANPASHLFLRLGG
jgi:hypothetical protein